MYVLLGANGNITSKAARQLLSQGKAVRVVGRSAASLATLAQAGADIAVGDLADTDFLAGALRGADAAYVMIPPNYGAQDMRGYQDKIGESIARAIVAAGVRNVVNLSSTGAHLAEGTGPIVGLHRQERRLNALDGVNVLHLRPGYFFENHFAARGTIEALGAYADMIASDVPLPTIASADIAAVVARELADFTTRGKRILHLRGPRAYSQAEAAAILGAAIGRPGLRHVQADPAVVKAGMMQHGFSADAASQFEEMSAAFSQPSLNAAVAAGPTEITPTTLEEFAIQAFAPALRTAA